MGQFFKQTIASIIGTIAGLLLLITLGTTGFVMLLVTATANTSAESQVKNQSILVLDLSIPIRDSVAPMGIEQVFAGEMDRALTLRDVLQSLEKASQDDRIVGLFLDGRKGDAVSGYAVMAEVRAAIAKFQATGKKIIAYDVGWSEQKYYLASMADEVILNPMGILEFNGLSSQQTFFQGALEKYGIGVQIVRVGDYKSAVEPYTRKGFSVENRQQTRELLDDLWDKFLITVAENRQLDTKYLQQIADRQGFIEPEAAKKIGLVSEVAYFDTVSTKLRELTGELEPKKDSFRQIDLSDYIRDRKATDLEAKSTTEVIDRVAVIYAEGAIVGGKGSIEQIGSDRFAKELSELRKDKNIKAIVLRVNSPGGSATASDVILREVLLAKEEKPVIVSMGNVAASGGYWIAAGADYIFAEENTITGSIGVFGLLPNIQKIGNDHGITWDVVQTGKLADISSTVRPKTDTELAIFQQSVKQTYNLFLDKVAQYRKLPKDKVHQIAQGRVWSGKEAVKIGLVDRIGGLDAAIAYAAQQAKLDNNWIVQEYPQNHSWETELVTRLMQTEGIKILQQNDSMTQELQKIKQEFEVFQSFDDPRHIYAHSSLDVNFK
jgi:protease IV